MQMPTAEELDKFILSHIEVQFKDQFVSRRDMWKIT
jgi:hypothetical protein